MDDRTYNIAVGLLVVVIVAILVDAVGQTYEAPAGLWTALTGIAAFLGGREVFRRNGKNGNGNGRRNGAT